MSEDRTSGRRQQGRVTVTDVARAAGVSLMTVSRVVNREPNVRPATRDAVETVIAALGYRPNTAARQLAGAAYCRVALLYANPSAAYLSEFLIGSLAAADVELVVERCEVGEPADAIVARLSSHRIDGVVLPPPLCDDAALRDLLAAADMLTVLVATGAPPTGAMAVTIDDEAAAAEMTWHLLAFGHRRIGFVRGDFRQTASARRLDGYKKALSNAGLSADPAVIVAGDFSYRSGLIAAERLLSLAEPPTALFASNDDMAAAALAVAHRRGLDVHRDLTVVGFDDTAVATTVWPELTTIRQPVANMARAAVEMLVAAARRRRTGLRIVSEHLVFPHVLIRRESDAPRLD